MTAATWEKEVEKKLLEAGNRLLSPPSTVSELLSLLTRVEELLGSVEQSPSESMRESLSPSTKALITDDLIRHSDVDVKVAVASCLSEITRITAPDAPYDDDQMKEVFQLIVSSFEKLDDTNSPSYERRVVILETVAKVRSCVVMLDLECDGLIIEMFQHFFKSIRDIHPEKVLCSMETIMSLVLEESEEISSELISTILDVLKKGNMDVLPAARHLGEKVLEQCASKLKPCLLLALRSSGTSFDDYNKAVEDACQAGNGTVEPCDGDTASKNLADESQAGNKPSEKAVEVAMETLDDATPDKVGPSTVGSPKSVMGNGYLKEVDDISVGNDNIKESAHSVHEEEAEPSKTGVDGDVEEPTKSQARAGKPNRRKRKPNSSKSSSELVLSDSKTEAVKEPENETNDAKDGDEDPVADTAEPAANERTSEVPVSSSKTSDNEIVDAASSPSSSLGNEARSKKPGRPKKKDDSMQYDVTTSDVNSKKESNTKMESNTKKESDIKKSSEDATVPESKSNKRGIKKLSSLPNEEESAPSLASGKKKDAENTKELDAKSDKDLNKKEHGSSQREEKKQRSKGKTLVKDNAKTPSKGEKKPAALSKSTPKSGKEVSDAEKTSKSSSKSKHSGESQATNTKTYGPELIGAIVKVWWPDDKKFYKGIVESFDADEKKHKVLYDDGDIEILNFEEEKWNLVSGALPSQGDSNDRVSDDESADDMPKGKKAKTSSDRGSKQGKTVTPSKKSGGSSKSKATPKSGSKQKDAGKPTEEATKNVAKSGGNSKGSKSGNKLVRGTPKFAGKPKDEDTPKAKKAKHDTAKGSVKSKGKLHKSSDKINSSTSAKADSDSSEEEETTGMPKDDEDTPKAKKAKHDTAKGSVKSKGKSHKSSGKINSSTSAKADSDMSEEEETEDEQSLEPAETPDVSKGKSQSASKSQKNSNSKKRKRSVKG